MWHQKFVSIGNHSFIALRCVEVGKGKGTVAEPWPTAEELWKDPEVQKSIQAHNQSVKKRNGS